MPHDDPHGPIVLFGLPAEAREAVFEALRSAGVEERFVHTASLDELVDNGVQLTDVVQELVDDLDLQQRLARTARELRILEGAMDQARDAMVVTDAQVTEAGPVIRWVNPAFGDLVGHAPGDLIGVRLFGLSPLRPSRRRIGRALLRHGSWEGALMYGPLDALSHLEVRISPVRDPGGEIVHFVAILRDVTEKKRVEERLQHLAHHDHLTSLPNRKLLMDRLNLALARARRYTAPLAVLFIDLDGFKPINDTLGHAAGDDVLVTVSERLRALVRASDTVARLGGDEFVVLLPEVRAIENAERVAAKVVESVSEVMRIGDHELFVTPSIGLAVWPDHGDGADELLLRADQAMYAAKASGKSTSVTWNAELEVPTRSISELVSELAEAFTGDQLHVDGQPIVDTLTGPVAVEVLLRWTHPERGPISPAAFLPLIEQAGLSREMLAFMVYRGAPWIAGTELALSFDVRPEWLVADGAIAALQDALTRTGLTADRLQIEVSEAALLEVDHAATAALEELRDLGVRVIADHYGTSHLSVPLLRNLPLDGLKLHGSLTGTVAEDEALVQGLVTLCRSLELDLVADGVGGFTQRDILTRLGITVQEGPLHGRPGPIQALRLPQTRSSAS